VLKGRRLGPIDEGYLLEVSSQLAEFLYSHQLAGKKNREPGLWIWICIRICINMSCWIRIRILNADPDQVIFMY
jgi:hypothetical protein